MKELDKRNVEYPDIQAGMYFVDTEGKIYFYQDNSEVPVKLNANGYKFVTLKRKVDLKKIRIPVHRIVAHTFIPKSLQDKLYDRDKVHFIDFDKNNTSVKNLEWINDKELNILSEIHKKGLTKIEDMEPYVKQLIWFIGVNILYIYFYI